MTTLKSIALELLQKYEESETSVIWEYSGDIEKSEKYLDAEVTKYRELINKYAEQEPNGDVVSRQAVQIELAKCEVVDIHDENDNLVGYYNADTVDSIVRNLSSVRPQEQTGYWIDISISGEIDGQITKAYTCSKCGAISVFRMTGGKIINGDLCPNCGAKMIEPQESKK